MASHTHTHKQTHTHTYTSHCSVSSNHTSTCITHTHTHLTFVEIYSDVTALKVVGLVEDDGTVVTPLTRPRHYGVLELMGSHEVDIEVILAPELA